MTTQEKFIIAIKQLMKKYQTLGTGGCPLCVITQNIKGNTLCKPCPNTIFLPDGLDDPSCYRAKTYKIGINRVYRLARYHFWKEALPILEKLPSRAFTLSGYKNSYFEFLKEIDERMFNKYLKTKKS